MSAVVVPVVPGSAIRPRHIAEAAAVCGHSPVFVAVAGAVDAREAAEYESFGPVVACEPQRTGDAVSALRTHRPAGITAFSEGMLPLTAELAAGLELPFHDPDTAVLLTNKWAQRQRLAQAGVDAVPSTLVRSRAEVLAALAQQPGPVVVKPVRSQSSRDTYFVTDPDQLPEALAPSAERPFVVEEYLRGRDEGDFGDFVSVEALVVGDDVFTLGITGKFPMLVPFREQGHMFPAHFTAAEQDAMASLAADATRALGVREGLVHTEVKLTPDGPRIIEVNGRIGGYIGDVYRRVTGQDWLALGIAVACGDSTDPAPPPSGGPVEFIFFNNPPLDGGTLRRVEGLAAVRSEPGVVRYVARFPVGHEFVPDVATAWLDALEGSAPDYDAMLKTIDRCLEHMRFVFQQQDAPERVWQASRSGLCPVG
jgi:hypothetical protein